LNAELIDLIKPVWNSPFVRVGVCQYKSPVQYKSEQLQPYIDTYMYIQMNS